MSVVGTVIANIVANNDNFKKTFDDSAAHSTKTLAKMQADNKTFYAAQKAMAIKASDGLVDPIRQSMKDAWKVDNSQRLGSGTKTFFSSELLEIQSQMTKKDRLRAIEAAAWKKHVKGMSETSKIASIGNGLSTELAASLGMKKLVGVAAGATGLLTVVDMMTRGRDATAGFSQAIFGLADAITKLDNPLRRAKSKPFSVGTDDELRESAEKHLEQLRTLNSTKERDEILFGKNLGDTPMIDPAISAELEKSNNAANDIIFDARAQIKDLIGDGSGKTIWDQKNKIWVKPAANDDPRVLEAETRIKRAERMIRDNRAAEERQEQLAQNQFKGRFQFGGAQNKFADGAVNSIGGFFNGINNKFKDFNQFSEQAQADFAKKERRDEFERSVDPGKAFAKKIQDIDLEKSRLGLDDQTVGMMKLGAQKEFASALGFDPNRPRFASAIRGDSAQAFNALLDQQQKKEDPVVPAVEKLHEINKEQLEVQKKMLEAAAVKPQIANG